MKPLPDRCLYFVRQEGLDMRADESEAYRERIVVDPHILVGKPVTTSVFR